jgi:hypothetical protein
MATPLRGLLALGSLAALPFAVMALKCRSLAIGLYSVTAWNVYAAGIWPGLFARRIDPAAWIDSTVVQDRNNREAVRTPCLGDAFKDLVTGSGAHGASRGGAPVETATAS